MPVTCQRSKQLLDQRRQLTAIRCAEPSQDSLERLRPGRLHVLGGSPAGNGQMKSQCPPMATTLPVKQSVRDETVHQPHRGRVREAQVPPQLLNAQPLEGGHRDQRRSRACASPGEFLDPRAHRICDGHGKCPQQVLGALL